VSTTKYPNKQEVGGRDEHENRKKKTMIESLNLNDEAFPVELRIDDCGCHGGATKHPAGLDRLDQSEQDFVMFLYNFSTSNPSFGSILFGFFC
jgi:hypothetical protein